MNIKDLQLVIVLWDADVGLVSMSVPEVLFYCWRPGDWWYDASIVKVFVVDSDLASVANDPEAPNWGDVVPYLKAHPELWQK